MRDRVFPEPAPDKALALDQQRVQRSRGKPKPTQSAATANHPTDCLNKPAMSAVFAQAATRIHWSSIPPAVARSSSLDSGRVIRRMQLTPTKTSNAPFNPRPENGPGGLPIGLGWRPADTSKIDLAMVRMSISSLAQPKRYDPEEPVGPASELTIPSIEDDVASHLRHWFLLFRIPNPDLGPTNPEELDAAEAKAFLETVGQSDPTKYEEELLRRAPLKSKGTVWMQVDVTGSQKAIYRTAWKNLPTTSGPVVDYAGTCNLTVADVRKQMDGLLAEFPDYINKAPKAGEGTPPGVYYCHTFVRLMNARLGLNIKIPTVTAYK